MAALSWIVLFTVLCTVHGGIVRGYKFYPINITGEYTVEIYVVVDHSAYLNWYNMTEGSQRQEKTVALIKKLYGAMAQDLDVLYLEQFDSSLQLSVVLTGIQVLSERGIVNDPSGKIDSKVALNEYWEWVKAGNLKDVPRHDQVIFITGLRLMPKYRTVHTFRGSMCQPNSLSVLFDNRGYFQVFRMAQEIAHGLGATPDGQNGCWLVLNLMSPGSSPRYRDIWHFSPCSVFQVKFDIQRLKNRGGEDYCLEKRESKSGPTLGDLYSADEMCVMQQGHGSYVCRSEYSRVGYSYERLCRNMFCRDSHAIKWGSITCEEGLAINGISCGNKKICQFGKCVYNENAESKPEDCPQGDQPGRVITTPYTCAEMIKSAPHYCYRNFYKSSCCDACKKIETGNKDCEYGDKANWCARLDRKYCSRSSSQKMCCATCR